MLKKLTKFLLKSVLWILAIVVCVVLIGYFTASYWVVPVVNTYAPKVVQANVSLAKADISLLSGHLSFNDLKIGNPEGFPKDDLFKLDEISVQFQPKSVLTDKIIVDKVLIKGTKILAELNQHGQINLMVLNQNIQNYFNKGTQPTQKAASGASKNKSASTPTKTVVIKDLQIVDSSVQVGFLGKKSTLNLPDIQEKNIGEKKETSLKESVMIIVNKLTVQPLEEIQKSGQKALKDTLNYLSTKKDRGATKAFQLIESSFSNMLK